LATYGVKLGGVLSPVLFCVYIDDMLLTVSKTGVECYIGNVFVGALAYADDIVIIAPSACAMRKLLNVCDKYANEYHIVFNVEKSKYLAFLSKNRHFLSEHLMTGLFNTGNNPIEFVQLYSHLGHIINTELSDSGDILSRRFSSVGQVNNVLCYFRKLDLHLKHKFFSSQCNNNVFGCELWTLSNEKINDLCIARRTGSRRIWELSYSTHCFLIPL
jgi:Reverse transcriptase (RNA-dependent DNA polymerase)